jgi:putative tricarboxylic transport membrane protein
MHRRHTLHAVAGTLLAALGPIVVAQQTVQPKSAADLSLTSFPLLRIYIPAGVGGGWDQTGRALGAAIQSAGLAQQVEYLNKGGKGGIIGLTEFVEKYDRDPTALLVGGMVMVGAIAVNRPPTTLAQVTPIARLTSDYLVLVAPPDSALKDTKALVAAMQKHLASVVFTGGSVGGVDHMLAGMMVRQLRLDVGALKYEPTTSGKEAIALLASGKAQVAISSYGEFKAGIESKALVPLAVSSRHSLFGLPSLTEQGIATDLANWRGVFGPSGIRTEQTDALRNAVIKATDTAVWKQALLANNWVGVLQHGKSFRDTLEIEQAMAGAVTMMLKLKS